MTKRILITGGPVHAYIDSVKIVTNRFKGGRRCMRCGSIKRSGENHPNYNPDLTDEEREDNKNRTSDHLYIRWRKKVYKRDKYLCQRCSQKGGQLNAHHLISWANNKKLRLVESNGATLCEKCHKNFHSIYGRKNNTIKQFEEYKKVV